MAFIDLVDDTIGLLGDQLAKSERPCVAWSAGKDSQVMLWLILSMRPSIPAVYFAPFEHPTKHEFAETIIDEWGLDWISPAPIGRDLVTAPDGHVEIVELYQIGNGQCMYFPVEAEPGYVPDEYARCGKNLLEGGPISSGHLDFDAVFIGHRGDDVDPVYGAVRLQAHVVERDGFRYVYPLRDWTEADIWEASRRFNIPQNTARYEERRMSANADYWNLCTDCLHPDPDGSGVQCPRTGQRVPLLPDTLDLDARREEWRKVFVNL